MSKKFYVVWKGAKTGVFGSWAEVKNYTQGRNDAQFMGFESKIEAEQAFAETYTKALMKRSLAKGKSGTTQTSKSTKSSYNSASSKAASYSTSKIDADIKIYCDGACSPNPGKSGTGIAIYHQSPDKKDMIHTLYYGLYESNGTNNTAELNGLLESFKLAQAYIKEKKTVQILSDSKYSIDCITKWAKGWQAKGWTRGKGEEIKNLAIIQQCFGLYQTLKNDVTISHVKGHANIEGNELADRMAVLARSKQQIPFIQYTGKLDIHAILAMPSG